MNYIEQFMDDNDIKINEEFYVIDENGEKYTVAQLSEKTGIGYEKLRLAYHKGNIMNIIQEVK